ncbi:hypothetical protein I553_3416 [Mycobacterium xenopi 4042]|uniref:Uncharacterized protein n=1 Tax=Mycobacterium xenopi 4042 TaxID=1299334 RepID=X7ZYX5_MYCXE|nr:hypothetical protein I553_3416 [Mycobacterium xenopi 4042]
MPVPNVRNCGCHAAELRRAGSGAEVPLRETTFVVVDLETTGDVRPVPRRQRPTRSPRSER